jgi:TIR domain
MLQSGVRLLRQLAAAHHIPSTGLKMPERNAPKIFINYSHTDSEFARKLAADLQAAGFSVWLDQTELQIGQNWADEIERAINDSDHILVLLSSASLKSRWMHAQINMVLTKTNAKTSRVIPVIIDPSAKSSVPAPLKLLTGVDLSSRSTYNLELKRLADQLWRTSRPDFRREDSFVNAGAQKTAVRQQAAPRAQSEKRSPDVVDIARLAKEVAKELAPLIASPAPVNVSGSPLEYSNQKLVFVIMSFSPDMDPIFQGIADAAAAAGFEAKRVKDFVGDYRITTRIVELINEAAILVVDLTHERPNVYFELGYARGIGKNVITTAREGTQVHFDVRDWTCTFYSDSRILEKSLRSRFALERERMERNAL